MNGPNAVDTANRPKLVRWARYTVGLGATIIPLFFVEATKRRIVAIVWILSHEYILGIGFFLLVWWTGWYLVVRKRKVDAPKSSIELLCLLASLLCWIFCGYILLADSSTNFLEESVSVS